MSDTNAMNNQPNYERGPLSSGKFFWSGAVGSSLTAAEVCKMGMCPREIRVFQAGNLNVTYLDGTSEVIVGIPAGHILTNGNIVSISATSSTAYNLYIGW